MRRFRPSVQPLEPRLCLDASPWTVGPTLPAGTNSGATLGVYAGLAILTGSSNGDTINVFDDGAGDTHVSVSNSAGSDDFVFPSADALEVSAGGGTNVITSTSSGTEILIGGTGDNSIKAGSGMAFLVSRGSGANDLTAGSYYTAFIAASSGSTTMHASGQFCSASMMLGVNTYDTGAASNVVYVYGGNDTVAGTGDADVYAVAPVTVTDPNARLHTGLY